MSPGAQLGVGRLASSGSVCPLLAVRRTRCELNHTGFNAPVSHQFQPAPARLAGQFWLRFCIQPGILSVKPDRPARWAVSEGCQNPSEASCGLLQPPVAFQQTAQMLHADDFAVGILGIRIDHPAIQAPMTRLSLSLVLCDQELLFVQALCGYKTRLSASAGGRQRGEFLQAVVGGYVGGVVVVHGRSWYAAGRDSGE